MLLTALRRNDGTVAIIDKNNIVWSVDFAPAVPNPQSEVLATGQTLTQDTKLYSADLAAYVEAQGDGNVVLCALPTSFPAEDDVS